eukprot:GEZU01025372.1.p2 GENE.GEZU01025372.1~~GEZU01025372.1.p2  ORF type:complete len:232 (+),score=49.49 GEZU01025372.1:82-777(+)
MAAIADRYADLIFDYRMNYQEQVEQKIGLIIGAGLNFLLFVIFNWNPAYSYGRRIKSYLMVALLIISCANTYWFFSRRKKYQLLNVAKKTAPADPATGSSSAAPSKPFSAFTKPYNTAPVDSRNISTVHIPRPQQQQQPQQPRTQQQKKQKLLSAALQLSVWDYSPIARDIFCLFSPVQVFQQMLVGTMKTADDWNVTPYFAFLVAYSIPAAVRSTNKQNKRLLVLSQKHG